MDSTVTVTRTVAVGRYTVTETATATLADDLTLDDATEGRRRQVLAHFLFCALPQLQPKPKSPPCPRPPTSPNSNN